MPDRHSHLRTKYKMSLAHYDWLNDLQGGICAICGGPPDRNGLFVIDHDHDSGEVRGLLCDSCNKAIGFAKENPHLLRKAAAYIESEGLSKQFSECDLPDPQPRMSGCKPGSFPKILDWDSVREIRRRISSGETQSSLAREYGVSQVLISRIKLNKTWREHGRKAF